jgi:hypothetical protein
MVLIKGMPSPWDQAAKAMFDLKGLDYVAAPWILGEANEDVVAWGGEASAPIVAWANERPIHCWLYILYLAERLAPAPQLIPEEPRESALMVGFAHEICGVNGIGWNRRLQGFAPAYTSGQLPDIIRRMGGKYGFNEADAELVGERIARWLAALAEQLRSQYARGAHYFVDHGLSALDTYWTTSSNLFDPLPKEQCPMPGDWRHSFIAFDPVVRAALHPLLMEHRTEIFTRYFRIPMEL